MKLQNFNNILELKNYLDLSSNDTITYKGMICYIEQGLRCDPLDEGQTELYKELKSILNKKYNVRLS